MRKKSAKQSSENHENQVLEPFLPKNDDFGTFVCGFYIQIPLKIDFFRKSRRKFKFEIFLRGML